MLFGGTCAFVHAWFPFLCTRTPSNVCRQIVTEVEERYAYPQEEQSEEEQQEEEDSQEEEQEEQQEEKDQQQEDTHAHIENNLTNENVLWDDEFSHLY